MNKKNTRILSTTLSAVGLILVGVAILDQLRQPPEQRTWQGHVFGIPYDFRVPTVERIRAKVWNKNTSQILMPHVFGVGWSINFHPLFHRETS
jgi:hypothetical protein